MTIINSILTGLARNNETTQKSQVPAPKQTIDPSKIYEESSNEITTPEDVLIDFSKRSKEAFSLLDYMDDIPDIREQKVAELRQRIQDGTYTFDYEQTAANMVDEYLSGKL
ncbi:MAG: flagellar biosynthesis anti-sigma factor FlgM [Candidatus Magnetomorum sp.]|nr:flagellar biosynthesis anti-sigma factor FlgM [Candidatus Magnetomorum sp.]